MSNYSQLQEALQKIAETLSSPVTTAKEFFEGDEGKAWQIQDREHYIKYYATKPEEFKTSFGPRVTVCSNGRVGALISFRAGKKNLNISIEGDPVCCGVSYLYGFSITEQFPQDVLKSIFDAILPWAASNIGGARNFRYFINMVERGRYCKNPLNPPEPIDKPAMQYPELYTFLMENCAKVNTTLCPNVNTGNIIHHMECLFDMSKYTY